MHCGQVRAGATQQWGKRQNEQEQEGTQQRGNAARNNGRIGGSTRDTAFVFRPITFDAPGPRAVQRESLSLRTAPHI